MRIRCCLVRVAVFLGAGLSLGADQDAVFRSGVDLVTVDATVLASDGRPVTDLGPQDFLLTVDGRTRAVVSAQFIASQASVGGRPSLFMRHFTSNEHLETGRLIVVAADETHLRRLEGRTAFRAAAAFIDRLDPADRVAVTSLSRSHVIEFTHDRRALKRKLDTLVGQGDPVFLQFNIGLAEATEIADGGRARLADVVLRECGRPLTEYNNPARAADDALGGRDACPEQVEQEARALSQQARTQGRLSLSALGGLIAALKPLDGPKTIVLLSEGMVIDSRLVDISELAAAATDARVTIYALHLEVPLFEPSQDRVSPTLLRDFELRGDGLSRLAGATRGAVYRLVGSDPRPFNRIVTELSGYYLLAFEADERDRDGRVHRVQVSLRRGGDVLRSRNAFRWPHVRPSPRTREQTLVALLRTVSPATELPVRVATYGYAEPGSPQVRVVVSAEAEAAAGRASEVLVGYVLIDARGVIAASGAHRTADGRHAFSTRVAPGAYTLRVAGIDSFGRKGLVERPFQTVLHTQAGLSVSDLIVAPVPSVEDAPLQPFVDRITAERVTANVEIYTADQPSALDNLQVVFEIASEGAAMPHRTAAAKLVTHDRGWAIARAVISLADLSAGRYVAVARVTIGGTEIDPVVRPFTYQP